MQEAYIHGYWAATNGNALINKLIRTASAEIKEGMEDLLQGREIVVTFDEQIVFDQLDHVQNAIWSLLVASGYLSRNPYLDARVGIGFQDFGDYACGKQFYVDKTPWSICNYPCSSGIAVLLDQYQQPQADRRHDPPSSAAEQA